MLSRAGNAPPDGRSYYVRAYIGLGDAFAKDGHFENARQAWQEGLTAFPIDPELQQRIALQTEDEARELLLAP